MSTIERDLEMWAEGTMDETDVISHHGDEARSLMELHRMLCSVETPQLPDFETVILRLEDRPLGFVDRMRMKVQRPLAVALGSALMTGGAAYAAVPEVREAWNNAVEKVGEAMGIVESKPAGDLTPDSDQVVPGDNSRLNDDPTLEGVGEQGMGRGPVVGSEKGKAKGKGNRKDGQAVSGEHRKDGEKRPDRSATGSENAAAPETGSENSADPSGDTPGTGASSADKGPSVSPGSQGNGKPEDAGRPEDTGPKEKLEQISLELAP